MAVQLQTALKNTLLSAHLSASQIASFSSQLDNIKQAIALISYSERELGLTPATLTATLVIRTESEIITVLESTIVTITEVSENVEYESVSPILVIAFIYIASVIESYRIFVN